MTRNPMFLAVALAWTSCGGEETPAGSDAGGGSPDTGTAADTSGPDSTDDATAASPFHRDTTFRATFVDVLQPSAVGAILTPLINNDIESGRLHVLVDVRDFAATSGDTTFRATGSAGQPTGTPGEYTWHDAVDPASIVYVAATMSAAGHFENTEPASVQFPAPMPGTEPPEIFIVPLKDIHMVGDMEEVDGTVATVAFFSGAILREDAETIEVRLSPESEPRTLASMLEGEPMNYPEEGPDATGWRFEADVDGEAVAFVEPE